MAFLLHPCAGYGLSQRFGVNRRFYPPFRARNGQMWPGGHEGLDFATPPGTPIVAAHDGTVSAVTRLNAVQRLSRALQPPYGNHIRLETVVSGLHVTTIYAHLDSVTAGLKRGSVVDAGQVIGLSGNTGRVLGDQTKGWHLHFGVNIDDYPVDPEPLIVGGV